MSDSEASFKPPPVIECIAQEECLGIGKKIYSPEKVCSECLRRHEPELLRSLATGCGQALAAIEEEVSRKRRVKVNLESHGRYLCAFEDPDYEHCRWRQRDLNLRGTRTNCLVVQQKGLACSKCWSRHLEKFRVIQYFTALGMCNEQVDAMSQEEDRTDPSSYMNDEDEVDDENPMEGCREQGE